MNRNLYTGNFPELQARFIAQVSDNRRRDPLAPLDVIVPSRLLRLALRRDLAREGGSHTNVRFYVLDDLAREAARPLMRERGLRPLHDVARGPLMMRAIENAGQLAYFEKISARDGFRHALWRTFGELRSAGIRITDLSHAADKLKNSRAQANLHAKLADLAAIWKSLRQLMDDHHFFDSHDLLELAADSASFDPAILLVLYGFDDLSALECRFVDVLLRDRSADVYLPFRDDPAHKWVRPLYDFFRKLSFKETVLAPSESHEIANLTSLRNGLFSADPQSENKSTENDGSIEILSAPTCEREAEETVRLMLHSPLADSTPQRRIGILLRESEPYGRLFRDELERAGIDGYFHRCRSLAETPDGRSLIYLTTLLDERFRRADAMEFLLSSAVIWPTNLDDPPVTIPAAQWNFFSLLAGIASGAAAWEDGLRRLQNQFESEQQRSTEGDEETDDTVLYSRLASLKNMQRYIAYLFGKIRAVNDEATWRGRTNAFWIFFTELIASGDENAEIEKALERADDLDDLGIPLTPEHFAGMIRTTLAEPAARESRFQVHEPTVASFHDAMGVLFDEVFLPGMVEKEIPRPVSQDPLLLEDDRHVLEKLSGCPVPTRACERDRERFLFHAAISSARIHITLSLPRRDAAQNRERLPSTFLLNIAEAVTGKRCNYSALDDLIRTFSLGCYVHSNRLQPHPLPAATSLQYDIEKLAEALLTRSFIPLASLLKSETFFMRALEAEHRRFHEREFSRFDGVIADGALRQALRELFKPSIYAFSPTRLERYATCPFQYFCLYVLGLGEIEEPSEIRELTPLERGSIVHEILERFFRNEREAGRLPLKDDAENRIEDAARQVFHSYSRNNITPLPLLWQIEQDHIVRRLKDVIRQEAQEETRFVPRHFEIRYGIAGGESPSRNEPLRIALEDGTTFAFRGRIDRIDVSPEGPARVIDYKTGRPQSGQKDGRIWGGRALQLPIYRLAAEFLLGAEVETAEYRFVFRDTGRLRVEYNREHWDNGQAEFYHVVRTILSGISTGSYFPYPEDDTCRTCPVRPTCGSGRLTSKWHKPEGRARDFAALREADS